MSVECGVSLTFLVPDKPSSDNNDMAAGDVWSRVTCTQIIGSAGCVSFCLFSANWPNEISLVVWLQVKSSEQFGDCPTSRVLFMRYCNLEVSGKGQPGEEESQGSSFTSTKDTCYCQGRSARSESQRYC